ncbi:hypothetical protein [Streptomyces sp. NPDC089795]|uniref:ATP-grasp domain-containing protein n=1 Tax=Streptomyces sp. NPDC089795 TaxID=3155297 RepID=UPI003440FCDA
MAELLTDKWQQRAALREAGADSVRTAMIHPEADRGGSRRAEARPRGRRRQYLPRPGRGQGGSATCARCRRRPGRGLVQGGGLVLEQYLVGRPTGPFGDDVSGEIAVVEGDRTTIGVRGKPPLVPPFRETGRLWPSPFGRAEDEEFTALARSAVAALGIRTGITHTELEVTPQGPCLIEVNGRLGGGIQELSLSAMDLDLTGYAARIALGETAPSRLVPVEGVHFQLILLAPRRSCEVVATEAVGVVGGVVPDHDAYVAPVERINSSVRRGFAFEGEPQPRFVNGTERFSL